MSKKGYDFALFTFSVLDTREKEEGCFQTKSSLLPHLKSCHSFAFLSAQVGSVLRLTRARFFL